MSTTPQSPELLALADQFPADEQADIARVAGVTVEHPSFRHFLGMARHYGLNPLLGDIWLIETDVFDRGSGTWVTDLRPAVGRDGFLKVASRDDNVITPPRSNVVYSKDEFSFEDDGTDVKITHKTTLARMDEATHEKGEMARGSVVGAWAKLFYRDGRPPFFYYAPIEEHGKRGSSAQDGEEPVEDWLGAWSYTSAMIAKCAQSYVLRIGAKITGVVPADEIRGGAKALTIAGSKGSWSDHPSAMVRQQATQGVTNELIVSELDVPDDLRATLAEALRRINTLSPFSWATAKVAIVTDGADEAKVRALIEEINVEIAKLGGEQVKVGA
jgi:hypothetical protein